MIVHGYNKSGLIEITIDGERLDIPNVLGNRYREMISKWEALGNTIPPYVPSTAIEVPSSISDRQFFQQLAIQGLITEQEAEDAVGPGIIPASMVTLINQLPVNQRFGARMLVRGATTFLRSHPVTELIGTLYGLNNAQIDTLWVNASKL